MAVHDGGDERDVAFNRVDESVGKAARPAFTMVFSDFSPSPRMTQNAGDSALDFVEEFQAQTGNSAVVVFGSFGKFTLGG